MGGALMGLANLVPGVSGGTMLVAAGIYDRFIQALSSITRLKWTRAELLLLVLIGAGAVLSLGGGAKIVSLGLSEARWQVYSLFIGLTLGGIPAMVTLCRPFDRNSWIGLGIGVLAMVILVVLQSQNTSGADDRANWVMLIIGGVAGASAMILPGISGAYLLLLLGQYRMIIDAVKDCASAAIGLDLNALYAPLTVLIPVGVGVVIGIAGVSNLLRLALSRARALTMGLLLGLLVAAPAGLWPFKVASPPQIGEVFKGAVVTQETLAQASDPKNAKSWNESYFKPGPMHIAGSAGFILLGAGITYGISLIGRRSESRSA